MIEERKAIMTQKKCKKYKVSFPTFSIGLVVVEGSGSTIGTAGRLGHDSRINRGSFRGGN